MEHALNCVTALFDSIDVPTFMGGERATASFASEQKISSNAHCHVTYRFRGDATVKDYHYTPISAESQWYPCFSTELLYLKGDEEPVFENLDIYTSHLILSYMEQYVCQKDKVSSDWKLLCAHTNYQQNTTNVAEEKANKVKNRCQDNLPFDNNRVKLAQENEETSDYINASFIYDDNPKLPTYVTTQCPLANTVVDFWKMIWQQNVVVVINLTLIEENMSESCQPYWPHKGMEVYNDFEIHLVSEHVWCADYIVRSFYVRNVITGESRTVTQFHYLSWSVSRVPIVKSLLNFRRKANKSFRGKNSPIVVHCSDGCGRTGTYVLLDIVLNRLAKGVKEIDVVASLEHLLDQRKNVVQTEEQFQFVLTAVAEEINAVLSSMAD